MKISYPNENHGLLTSPPRSINQWMKAMQAIYDQVPFLGFKTAFDTVTSKWEPDEKLDFQYWLRFYQEDAQNKYKVAQFTPRYIENGPGSVIPVDAVKANFPAKMPDLSGFSQYQDQQTANLKKTEEATRKQLVQDKLRALVSRLAAAEKIASLPEVQIALHKVLANGVSNWFATLQELKREIQLVPIRSSSLIDDLIYKNANKLKIKGSQAGANLLLKIAQVPLSPSQTNDQGVLPMNPIDVNPNGTRLGPSEGPPGNQPAALPPDPSFPSSHGDDFKQDPTMMAFLKLLDNPEADLNKSEDGLVVEAQLAEDPNEPKILPNNSPEAPATRLDNLTPEQPLLDPSLSPEASQIKSEDMDIERPINEMEDPFEAALAHVTVQDLVDRMEAVCSLYRKREMARQLAIIDLMMDRLGIASFFPSQAEAMKSALESNQYCQTRVEDNLAKIRGITTTPLGTQISDQVLNVEDPQVKAIQTQLAKSEEAEKLRKEKRKQMQNEQEDNAIANQQLNQQKAQELANAPTQVQQAPAPQPPKQPQAPQAPQPPIG